MDFLKHLGCKDSTVLLIVKTVEHRIALFLTLRNYVFILICILKVCIILNLLLLH